MTKGIDVNKTDVSHEHFLDIKVWNGCHNLMQKAMSFNEVAIASVMGNDYRIHFWYISKDKAINLL